MQLTPTFEIPKETVGFLAKIGQSNNGKYANPKMPIAVTVVRGSKRKYYYPLTRKFCQS